MEYSFASVCLVVYQLLLKIQYIANTSVLSCTVEICIPITGSPRVSRERRYSLQ